MNPKEKKLHTLAVALLCTIGIAPWIALNPSLQDDAFDEPVYVPLEVAAQVVPQMEPVIYFKAITIVGHRYTAHVAQNNDIRCRWHDHDETTGIKVCEYGRELHYPTFQ